MIFTATGCSSSSPVADNSPSSPSTGTTSAPSPPACANTVGIIAAHQDDDILFMDPDLQNAMNAGDCIHTLYVTAGDAGLSRAYWEKREKGPQAAYAQMTALPDSWTPAPLNINGISIRSLQLAGRPGITQSFLRLSDGFTDGSGSPGVDESLLKLFNGKDKAMHPLDQPQVSITRANLVAIIQGFLETQRVNQVWTQDYEGKLLCGKTQKSCPDDHSDHRVTARLTQEAVAAMPSKPPLRGYQDYNIGDYPANLDNTVAEAKLTTFMAYAPFDPEVCQTRRACLKGEYGPYYSRQYLVGQR